MISIDRLDMRICRYILEFRLLPYAVSSIVESSFLHPVRYLLTCNLTMAEDGAS